MADPVPAVSLPEREYLEILNRTDFQFNLKNWKLTSETSDAVFPETIIKPGERLIICPDAGYFIITKYGRVTESNHFLL